MQFNFDPTANSSKNPLKEFGRNLTDAASQRLLDPIIGRDNEIRHLIRILCRRRKNNPVLIGPAGVGKTAIAEGLAQRIVAGQVPENLRSKEIYELDLPAMLSGASFQGQFEKRLKSLMQKIKDSNGEIIVFLDEIHTLVGTGRNAQGGMDAAQILKPMLARGELRLIGATTFSEYKKYIETDPALERRMQKIVVDEPTKDETITILRGLKNTFENYHKVKILDSSLVAAVRLSVRYISDRYLPDKAIDLVDEAAANIRTEINSRPEPLEKAIEKIAILSMEKAALAKEKELRTQSRLLEITEELKVWEATRQKLTKRWQNEKKMVEDLAELKSRFSDLKDLQIRHQQEGEYEKASKLLYQEIPILHKKIKRLSEILKKDKNPLIKDTVTEREIAEIAAQWTKIPVQKLLTSERKTLLSLKAQLKSTVKGQDEAIRKVYNTIARVKTGVQDPHKPLGSFMFMGPTGVGKTYLAKMLAKSLFGSSRQLVRIDMSEYMEKHSVARLIGAPPGYVGHEQGGQLTEAIRRKPYSIILLDEIEKAHADVLDILLHILSNGTLTDSQGRTVDFKNTIVVLTTNITPTKKFLGKNADEAVREELLHHLKSEFINRLDEIILFNSLSPHVITKIVQTELTFVQNRLAEQEIYLSFEESVVRYVAHRAYSPIFGARRIKHFIQTHIETEIAQAILEKQVEQNGHYVVYATGGEISIHKRKLN